VFVVNQRALHGFLASAVNEDGFDDTACARKEKCNRIYNDCNASKEGYRKVHVQKAEAESAKSERRRKSGNLLQPLLPILGPLFFPLDFSIHVLLRRSQHVQHLLLEFSTPR
jgi:hypothetical protein